jgi:microsomal dipeptidase-like Zn-dependent dipeptidase
VCNNAFADSSTSKVGPVHGGLSKLGKSAIVEMNRLGMFSLLDPIKIKVYLQHYQV